MLVTEGSAAGRRLRGTTTATEDGVAWSVAYTIDVDDDWSTRRVAVTTLGAAGETRVVLERHGQDWSVDGVVRATLRGLLGVDLESSAVTNTLPVHRLGPTTGQVTRAPAVFVRATTLDVEVLEQTYEALDHGGRTIAYTAPRIDVACTLTYDRHGLVVDYPGLATRACCEDADPSGAAGPAGQRRLRRSRWPRTRLSG